MSKSMCSGCTASGREWPPDCPAVDRLEQKIASWAAPSCSGQRHMRSPAAVYRLFQRADGPAPSVRSVVLTLVIAAVVLTAIGIVRVTRQHEVLRLGFALSRTSEQVGRLHETRRQLELE